MAAAHGDCRPGYAVTGQDWLNTAALAGTAGLVVLCAATLLQRPVVGLADNLDGGRVMTPAGIAPRVDAGAFPDARVPRLYDETNADPSAGSSSAAGIAWLAKQLGFGLSGEAHAFDLRQLGALYTLGIACVLAAALAAGVAPLVVFGLAWVIADPVHLLYFNSFYPDAAMLLGVLGTTAWLLAWGDFDEGFFGPAKARDGIRLAALCGLLFTAGASRMANAALPALALPFLLARWLARPLPRPERPLRTAAVCLLLLAVTAGPIYHFGWGGGPRFLFVNSYHAVFTGIAEVSSDPGGALRALGVPDRLAPFAGRSIHQIPDRALLDPAGDPEPSLARLSRARLASLYLSDPPALARSEARLRAPLALARPPMPSFENEPGRYYTRAAQWSSLRSALVEGASPLLWCALTVLGVHLAARVLRRRPLSALECTLGYLLLCFSAQVVIAILGEGFFGIRLHLAGARLLLDLLLAVAIFATLERGIARAHSTGRRPAVSEASVTPGTP